MKKSVRIFATVLLIAMLGIMLASCSDTVSGKYSSNYYGSGVSMDFDGNDVRISINITNTEVAAINATYTIENNIITFDFSDDGNINDSFARSFLSNISKPVAFAEGDGYILIAGTKYVKSAE